MALGSDVSGAVGWAAVALAVWYVFGALDARCVASAPRAMRVCVKNRANWAYLGATGTLTQQARISISISTQLSAPMKLIQGFAYHLHCH